MKMKLLDMRDYVSIHKKQNKTPNQTTATTKQTNQSASRLQLWSQAVFIGEAACPQLTGRRDRNAPNFLLTWTLHSGLLGNGKNYILFGKCFGGPQNPRHPGSLEQRMCVLENDFLPSYCGISSVATSECTVLFLKDCSRSKRTRLPFVWLSLLIPWVSEFDGLGWGLQSLVIFFSVLYISDTDQHVHFQIIELWILTFTGLRVSYTPSSTSHKFRNEAFVARLA